MTSRTHACVSAYPPVRDCTLVEYASIHTYFLACMHKNTHKWSVNVCTIRRIGVLTYGRADWAYGRTYGCTGVSTGVVYIGYGRTGCTGVLAN